MARPFKCPYCGSTLTTWKGYRTTLAGRVRLRRCRDCGRKFRTQKLEPKPEEVDYI